MKIKLLFILLLSSISLNAQVVEQMPEFPGGEEAMLKYLYDNLQYPSVDMENGIKGKVIVRFMIEKDGSISEPFILQSVSKTIDAEAIRVVEGMPKFKPGLQDGKPVKVQYTLPLRFFFEEPRTVATENIDFDNISPKGWSFDLMVDGGRQFGDATDYFKNPFGFGVGVWFANPTDF